MSELKDLLKERDEFLQKNPQLLDYQKSIDSVLNKCKEEDRMPALQIIIASKLLELSEKMTELKNIVDRCK